MRLREIFDDRGPATGVVKKVAGLFCALTLATVPTVSSANETSGIGGGPEFPAGAEFPFIAGLETTITAGFFVQNLGTQPIDLGVSHAAPRGIVIEPSEGQKTTFAPGEAGTFLIDVTVTEPVVPDRYLTSVNIREASPLLPDEGGSLYIPAVTGDLVIDVVGASAFARLSAVSELTGSPAVGDLSLFYIGSNGLEVRINETRGSQIESRLVPGNYKFTFDVPGLQRQDFEFSIEEDEELELVFEIPTLEFLETGAVPTRDDRDYIQSVALVMEVYNNLGPIDEQIFFQTNVFKDEELVEEFVIGALPNLPEAGSLLRANFNPEGGFSQGDWEFQFEIVGESFTLVSDETVIINSPGIFQSYLQEIVIAIGALVILALLVPRKWWSRLFRRRSMFESARQRNGMDAETEANELSVLTQPSLSYKPDSPESPDLRDKPSSTQLQPVSGSSSKKPTSSEGRIQLTDAESHVEKPAEGEKKLEKTKPSKTQGQRLFGRKAPSEKRKNKVKANLGAPELGADRTEELENVISIRRRLLEMEGEGIRTLALNYKIDSIFVQDGETVINRSTGKPYDSRQIRSIEEFRGLEARLDNIETPALRAEAIKALVREQLVAGN